MKCDNCTKEVGAKGSFFELETKYLCLRCARKLGVLRYYNVLEEKEG
jgi:hypothetical protein